jgi:hypothetical protein
MSRSVAAMADTSPDSSVTAVTGNQTSITRPSVVRRRDGLAVQNPPDRLLKPRRQLDRRQVAVVHPQGLFLAPAVHARRSAVPFLDLSVQAKQNHRVVGVGHSGRQAARPPLRPAQAGNVVKRRHHALGVVLFRQVGHDAHQVGRSVGVPGVPLDDGPRVRDRLRGGRQVEIGEVHGQVRDRPAEVRRDQPQHPRRVRGEELHPQLAVQEQRRDSGGLQQVGQVAVGRRQPLGLVLKLAVDRGQLLVDRLQLLLGGLQLLVGGLKLFVGGNHFLVGDQQFLVGGLEFLDRGLKILLRRPQLFLELPDGRFASGFQGGLGTGNRGAGNVLEDHGQQRFEVRWRTCLP